MPLKTNETRERFIQLRAKGLSYSSIAKQIKVSKSTCSNWEKELKDQISQLKSDRLDDLYQEYGMLKEARIASIGKVLNKIDQAIDEADFSMMTPSQLLDFRLKYQKALNDEYVPTTTNSAKGNMIEVQTRLLELAELARNHELNDQSAKELKALTLVATTMEQADAAKFSHSMGLDYFDALNA